MTQSVVISRTDLLGTIMALFSGSRLLPLAAFMVVLLGTSLAADYTMQQGGAEPPLNFFHSHDMWSGTRMVAADPGLTSLDNVSLDDENELHMDEALLMVMSEDEEIYYVFIHYLVCEGCPTCATGHASPRRNYSHVMDSTSKANVVIANTTSKDGNSTNICSFSMFFGDQGQYLVKVNSSARPQCEIFTVVQPNSFLPLYVMLACLVGIELIWCIILYLHKRQAFHRIFRCQSTDGLVDSDLGSTNTITEGAMQAEPPPPRTVTPPKKRLKSLDAFRGFALMIMIFVNYGGGKYWFLHHATWNGLTVADLVFPWFVFMMGTSMPLAFRGLLIRNTPRLYMLKKVVKRTIILIVLGVVVSNDNGPAKFVNVRFPGVLQRLALTYFIVALIQVCFAKKDQQERGLHKWWAPVRDLLPYWPEWIIVFLLIAIHLAVTFALPLPDGCPTGYIGPGGKQYQGDYQNCTGGAAGFIDRWVFGDSHVYQHPTPKKWYETTLPYDPEGLLGTLNSAVLCYLGLQAGRILLVYNKKAKHLIPRWLIWSGITGLIAGILCLFSQNDGWIPVNKNLWSLSFILTTGSFAFFLLTLFFIIIDVGHVWSGSPFIYPGMNSIVVYMCHEIFAKCFPVQFSVENTHTYHLLMALWGASIWVVMAYVMHRKKVFIAI